MKNWKLFGLFTFIVLNIGLLKAIASIPENWDDVDKRTYNVNDFKDIHLEGGFKVILEQGPEVGLKIEADEDDFDYLQIDSEDGVLDIEIRDHHFTLDQIILYITFKELEHLHIEGGAKLETRGYIDLTNFLVKVEGGAKIEMDVKAESFELIGEGGVCFNLEGVSNSFKARLSGASYVDAEDFKCKNVDFRIEGVGSGSVYATDYLNAKIEGVGKIGYRGNPEVHKNIGGLGFVSRN